LLPAESHLGKCSDSAMHRHVAIGTVYQPLEAFVKVRGANLVHHMRVDPILEAPHGHANHMRAGLTGAEADRLHNALVAAIHHIKTAMPEQLAHAQPGGIEPVTATSLSTAEDRDQRPKGFAA